MGAGLNGIIFDDLELYPVSRSLYITSGIFQKRCVLGTKLLKNTNRKPYSFYLMVPLSMT